MPLPLRVEVVDHPLATLLATAHNVGMEMQLATAVRYRVLFSVQYSMLPTSGDQKYYISKVGNEEHLIKGCPGKFKKSISVED